MRKGWMVLGFVLVAGAAQGALKTWEGGTSLWKDANNWAPVGVPATNDDVVVTNGAAVLLDEDGTCASFAVSRDGFLIVNDTDRTLEVIGDGTVNGSGAELRVNVGRLNVGGSVTLLNDASLVLDAVNATATVYSLDYRDGTLEWNAGTLRFSNDLYMQGGQPISNLTVEADHTLEVASLTEFAVELYLGSTGSLTMNGGNVTCDSFTKLAGSTFDLVDGTFTINGEGLDWDETTQTLEGNTFSDRPTMVLNEFYLPVIATISNGIHVASSADRQGHLKVINYSNLHAPCTLAEGVGSLAEATVSNGASWTAGTMTVGGAGTGILSIEQNSWVQGCSKIEVGRDSTATGIVTVAGVGSRWDGYWQAQVGGHGVASVLVSNGASMQFGDQIGDTEFARYSGSRADITVTGPDSQFGIQSDAYSHTIYFGLSGQASLLVSNGASVTWDEFTVVGETSGSRGDIIVAGSNSSWMVDNDFWLGYRGTGTLQVLDGAVARTDSAKLGEFPGGVGQVTVSGAGSVWHGGGYASFGEEFSIGLYGTGELTVENGGTVYSSGFSELGQYSGSRGTVTVTDPGSLWAISDELTIGYYVSGITSRLTVANAGLVTVAKTATLFDGGTLDLNGGAQGAGTLDVKTLDLSNGGDITGDSNGILRVHSVTVRPTDWTLPASLQIGSTSHNASASWTIGSGESLTVAADFCIGYDAEATLTITNDGQITSGSGVIGQIYGATGQVTVTGSSAFWNISSNLTIGGEGSGSLTLVDGGHVTADQITINSHLTISNGLNQGRLTLLDGGSITANQITINGPSVLSGNGSIIGNLTSDGLISPGSSPGILSVTGNVELLSTYSLLEVELAGTARGTEYDALDVTGAMTLGGILTVTLDGFTPALGDRFDLLDFGSASGTFDTVDLPALPAGQEWYTDNLNVDGSILVSLPAAWLSRYGLSPTNDPFADPDEDKYSTAEEYTADTNPTNGASYFRVTDVDGYPDPTVYFNSSTARMYTLSFCSNMLVDTWGAVPGSGPRSGVGGPDTFGDTNEPVAGLFYYRLGVELP